jgi:predicted AAA+ superfamily ATPase
MPCAKIRGLRKMPKLYLWDWSFVSEPGPRLENLVASHLMKLVHFLQDHDGHPVELKYLRDRSGKETDFIVVIGQKPWLAVEVKLAATQIDSAFVHFRDRLKIPWVYQVVLESERDFVEQGVRCLPAHRFLAALI